jgi:hypothetical protein
VLNLTPLRTAHSAGVSLSTSAPITAISACVREEVRSGDGDYSEKNKRPLPVKAAAFLSYDARQIWTSTAGL